MGNGRKGLAEYGNCYQSRRNKPDDKPPPETDTVAEKHSYIVPDIGTEKGMVRNEHGFKKLVDEVWISFITFMLRGEKRSSRGEKEAINRNRETARRGSPPLGILRTDGRRGSSR